jgi:shikimate kinase
VNIALIGYRWSGKTTVSRELAERIGWPRVESDRMVEECLGMSIAEAARRLGWGVFRSAEEAVIAAQLQRDRIVLDLGGGAVTDPATRARLRQSAWVVLLDCSEEVLLTRSKSSYPRPALTALSPREELRLKLEERRPLYLSCADLVVDASHSPSECAAAILANMPAVRRSVERDGGQSPEQGALVPGRAHLQLTKEAYR